MTSPRYSQALLLLADGARPDILQELLQTGRLPNIQKHLVERGAFRTITSAFPSTTGPAYLPYLTGRSPGSCNLPGIRWFDKTQYAKTGWGFRAFRSYCGPESAFFDRDLAEDVVTVWHIFPDGKNILGGVRKGLKPKNDLTRFSRSFQYLKAHQTHNWLALDRFSQKKILNALKNPDSRFIFAVYPAIDEYAHLYSPFADKTLAAYENFDRYVGEIFSQLSECGQEESTLVAIVSDHGHAEVREHFDVGPWLESHLNISTLYYTNIFKFRFDAVSMVSGNGMAHLYFKRASGWEGRMSFEEFGFKNPVIEELRRHSLVDFLICAESDGTLRLISNNGESRLRYEPTLRLFRYYHFGADPLQVFPATGSWAEHQFSDSESHALTFSGAYPDAFWQIVQIFTSKRCGDVVVLAKPGADLRVKFERYEHFSGHGGLQREHMLVPLMTNAPLAEGVFRSVDVFPTLVAHLGEKIPEGCEGRPIPLR